MNEPIKYTIVWYKSEVMEAINLHRLLVYNDNELIWAISNLTKLMQELKAK